MAMADGCLQVSFLYSGKVLLSTAIEQLNHQLHNQLTQLLELGESATMSDTESIPDSTLPFDEEAQADQAPPLSSAVIDGSDNVAAELTAALKQGQALANVALDHSDYSGLRPAYLAPEPIETVLPLPAYLHGMLSYNANHPASAVYKVQNAFNWEGPADEACLQQAWQALVQRHQALRMSVYELDADPAVLVVHREVSLPWSQHDWRDLSFADQETAYAELLEECLQFDFLPSQAPMMQLHWILLGDERQRLLWVHHHAIADGWSAAVLWREVFQLYEALLAQKTAALAINEDHHEPLDIEPFDLEEEAVSEPQPFDVTAAMAQWPAAARFEDYVRWRLSVDRQQLQHYWQQRFAALQRYPACFAGVPQRLRRWDRQGSHQEQMQELEWLAPAALSASLNHFLQEQGITAALLFQAAWALFLSRCEDADQVRFGMASAGRPAELDGVEQLVGLCLNALPCQIHIDTEQTLGEWLQQLRLQSHQDENHAQLAARDLSQTVGLNLPLFDTFLVCENLPHQMAELDQIRLTHVNGFSYNHYPLTLMLVPGEQWYLKVKYNAASVREDRITWLLQAFSSLLMHMCQDVNQQLADIHWSAPITREQWQQHYQSNDTAAVEVLYESMLPDVVRSIPDSHLALVAEDQRLDYAELRDEACRLAQYLCGVDVQLGDRVALILPVGTDHIIALLAIHFCGATAVLVDTQTSAADQQQVLDETACGIIITHSAYMNHLVAADDLAELVVLDRDQDDIAACKALDPQVSVFASSIACIVYEAVFDQDTSLRTLCGRLISHATLARDARQLMAPMGLVEDAVVACIAGDAGGFAYRAIFCALIHGLSLALEPVQDRRPSAEALQALSEHSVSAVLLSTAALSQAMASPAKPSQLPPYVLLGDVQASADFLARLNEQYPNTQFNAVLCESPVGMSAAHCVWQTEREDGELSTIVSGRGGQHLRVKQLLAHAELVVHDHSLRPVAAASAACLSIAGAGLADAYEQHSVLTSQRWVIDPQRKGRRLYHTEWLVRLDAAADIELWPRFERPHLARPFDERLGQLEYRLRRTPGIDGWCWQRTTEAAAKHDPEPSYELYVYGPLEPQALQGLQNLAQRAQCELYWQLAVSVDRATNLSLAAFTAPAEAAASTLPVTDVAATTSKTSADERDNQIATEIEEKLLAVWQELLQRESIGLDDAFLSIGGDSILVLQMVARARALGLPLDPQMVFEQQTIATLATHLSAQSKDSQAKGSPSKDLAAVADAQISPADTSDADTESEASVPPEVVVSSRYDGETCVLAPIQRRFFTQVTEQAHHYVQARVLQLPRDADEHSLRQALFTLWQQHAALRLSYDTTPLVVGQWPKAEFLAVDAMTPSDLLHCETVHLNDGWQAAIDEVTQYWFAQLDLAGPLFRALWLDGENGSSRLVLFAHHLVVDGVSWRTLQHDLIRAYEAAKQQQSIALVAHDSGYAEWTQALEHHRGVLAIEQREYWQQQAAQFASPQGQLALELELRQWQNEGFLNVDYRERHEPFSIQLSQALLSDAIGINELCIEDLLLAALARVCADAQAEAPVFPIPDALDQHRQGVQASSQGSFLWPAATANDASGAVARGLWIDLEAHGRDLLLSAQNANEEGQTPAEAPLEVERTVGWFTKLYPVQLPSAAHWHDAVLLTNVRHGLQQAAPFSDAYLLLRYGDEVPTTQQLPKPAVKFNYFGRISNNSEQAFALADEQARGLHSDLQNALYALNIDAVIAGRAGAEQLHMIWRYPAEYDERIQGLIGAYASALSSLLDHCIEWADRQGIEEPDPELEAEYSELDQLLDELETLL